MKILQILPEMTAGGVERGTLEIGSYLARQGHDSLVVSNGGSLVTALQAAHVRHIQQPVHRKSLFSLLQVAPFRRLLEQEQPDVIHIRSRIPGWIAWLAWRRLPAERRPALVSTVHGFYSANAYSAIMTRGQRVIAVSDCIREYVLRNYPKTPATRVRVVPRGIAIAAYPRGFRPDAAWQGSWARQYPQLTGKRVLTLPGRITRLKGHEDFLRLVARLTAEDDSLRGLIVGDAHPRKQSYLAEIQKLAAQLGLGDRVIFTGHRADLREVLALSEIVFSLSQKPESFGRTTLEALALGRPVVAYDHGGVGEQLRALYPAGLVPLHHETALSDTVGRVLRQPGAAAPIPAAYTLEAMCATTLEIYQELLRSLGRRSA